MKGTTSPSRHTRSSQTVTRSSSNSSLTSANSATGSTNASRKIPLRGSGSVASLQNSSGHRKSVRRNNHPVKSTYAVLLTTMAALLLVSLGLSLSFILRRMALRRSHKYVNEDGSLVIGKTFEELVGSQDTVTCQYASSQVKQKIWIDPNEGRVVSRPNLVTQPSFAMAVHKESYDPVRWESIYMKGKYYEDTVHDRFVQILQGSKESTRNAATKRVLRSNNTSRKPVEIVMDVGANIGYYTALSMSLGYSVLAFEINPPNLLRMCETVELNGWALPENDNNDNSKSPVVRFYQQGVSNQSGKDLEVWVPKNPGQAFMRSSDEVESLDSQSQHRDHTKTITLDNYAMQHGWLIPQGDEKRGTLTVNPNINVKILKIDVEGKEPLVIQGAEALLRSGLVENVLVEFRRLSREAVQEALLILLDSRYTLVHEGVKVSSTRAKELLVQLTEELSGKRRTVDLWFQKILQLP